MKRWTHHQKDVIRTVDISVGVTGLYCLSNCDSSVFLETNGSSDIYIKTDAGPYTYIIDYMKVTIMMDNVNTDYLGDT